MEPRQIHKLGWIPDLPDHRDYKFTHSLAAAQLPEAVDLRPHCPAIVDQGAIGSCTANAIASAFQYELRKQTGRSFAPSRLFIYYNERDIEGTTNEDSGAMIRDGIKSVASLGVCSERSWPYLTDRMYARPPERCYLRGLLHQALTYRRISHSLTDMKACLAQGNPFIFGFTVYESFESEEVANSGIVPYPHPSEAELGGHAVLAVGYDDKTGRFLVRNSWGRGWGMSGGFTLPYEYLTNPDLSDDFWAITMVETPKVHTA